MPRHPKKKLDIDKDAPVSILLDKLSEAADYRPAILEEREEGPGLRLTIGYDPSGKRPSRKYHHFIGGTTEDPMGFVADSIRQMRERGELTEEAGKMTILPVGGGVSW